MSATETSAGVATVLIVGDRAEPCTELAAALDGVIAEVATVARVDDIEAALDTADAIRSAGGVVPVIFVVPDPDAEIGPDMIARLDDVRTTYGSRVVAVMASASLARLQPLLHADVVDGIVTTPWSSAGLAKVFTAHLATFLVEHLPDRVGDFGALVGPHHIERAHVRIDRRRAAPARSTDRPHPLLDVSSEDAELEAQLVELLDRALGHPPRIRVAPNTVLIEIGSDVGGIYVVLEGAVRLTSRTQTGEQILHEQSTGSIVGLLSLASKRRAMLQCRTVTEVRAIPVTLEQLAQALDVEPELSSLLNRVLIGSLARRLRRSDELQVELDQSLMALAGARAELINRARMATLGDLSAGLAHELNNPTAALVRSIDHVVDDLTDGSLIDPDLVELIRHQLVVHPPTTTELRERRRRITAAVGDRRLAERLVDLGVTEPAEASRLAALPSQRLDRVETAVRVGAQLRNATSAARRVQALVDSLRSYVRGDDGAGPWVADVDVARTIHSAVRLLSHRIGDVELSLDLAAVPPIHGRPGPLQVVWGNLVANALDALARPDGHIGVELDQPDAEHVRVRVTDDGPGIEPDVAERIFEPRFTTKDGRVQFGLGLGLSMSRQIVDEHGGTIEVVSRPGRTVFTVILPVEAPDE